jgi:apolipoprotein N-acyltransferase
MASSDKRSIELAGVVATILSGAGWWFGTGLAPQAWLTWLAPLPLLWIAPRLRWQWAALAAVCSGACAGLNLWHYLRDIIRLPLATGVLVVTVPALTFALALLLHRRLLLAARPAAATLAFPALYVTLEYLNSLTSPHGTFGSLAYSQMDVLPVIQLASVTGIWGVTFVLLLAPSALAVVLQPSAGQRQRALIGGGVLMVLAGLFGFGVARLQQAPIGNVRVGLVSLHGPIKPALDSPQGQLLFERYVAAIDALAAQGAQTVVLPESAFGVAGTSIPALAERAARHKITIDVGASSNDRNLALAFTPSAAQPVAYAKRHLIPGFESQYKPGTDYATLPGARTGLAICKDMDFQDISHAYAQRGANLLLVPAWDFDADGWLHGRMAVMRGVESGFAIARAARRGTLTLSDDRGRVVAEASDEKGDAQLVGDLPLYQSRTLYTRWGDWFAWLNLALLTAVLLRVRRQA